MGVQLSIKGSLVIVPLISVLKIFIALFKIVYWGNIHFKPYSLCVYFYQYFLFNNDINNNNYQVYYYYYNYDDYENDYDSCLIYYYN